MLVATCACQCFADRTVKVLMHLRHERLVSVTERNT